MKQYRIDFESMAWESPVDSVRFKAYEQSGEKIAMVAKGELAENASKMKGK
jgi:hypothetical protein